MQARKNFVKAANQNKHDLARFYSTVQFSVDVRTSFFNASFCHLFHRKKIMKIRRRKGMKMGAFQCMDILRLADNNEATNLQQYFAKHNATTVVCKVFIIN